MLHSVVLCEIRSMESVRERVPGGTSVSDSVSLLERRSIECLRELVVD